MADETFRSFLNDVNERFFPDESSNVLEPESPPNWQRLGWKTGWIVEEAHTGLQWWVTDEHEWDELSGSFGETNRQKNQVFSQWYGSLLKTYRQKLGVPLKLETVRWRQMDLGAFEGRPLITEEDWWSVEFEGPSRSSWHLILSERFIQVFEEETETSSRPDPPWDFLEFWAQLNDRQKSEVLGCAGTNTGVLNHLSGLVLSGSLKSESIPGLMPRQPAEEFQNVLRNRQDQLSELSAGQERQTVKQWKQDAVTFLTDRVGDWLAEGELSGESWKQFRADWMDYRTDVLAETFDDRGWGALWSNLDSTDVERIVPRLNREALMVSLVDVVDRVRSRFREALPERQVRMLLDEAPGTRERIEVLKAREAVYSQIRNTVRSIDYKLKGTLALGPDQEGR